MREDDLLEERNQLSHELDRAMLALEPLAQIYDEFLKEKGKAWCRHWESIPLNQLLNDNVIFRMPTLKDCYDANIAVGGNR